MNKRTIKFIITHIFLLFYFLFVRIFFLYFFSYPSRIFNSIVFYSPIDMSVKGKMIYGNELRDMEMRKIKKGQQFSYFFQFHDLDGVNGFLIEKSKVSFVWLGKKVSFLSESIPLVKLEGQELNEKVYFSVEQRLISYVGLIGNLVIFLLDIFFLLLGFIFFKKHSWSSLKILGFLTALYISHISIIPLLTSTHGGSLKAVFFIMWIIDILIGLFIFLFFLEYINKKQKLIFKDVIFGLIILIMFWNINSVNMLWLTQRGKDFCGLIRNLGKDKEYRYRKSYSSYGALYDMGLFIHKVVLVPSNIGLPGRIFPVFGNGSLVRRFIYPHTDMIIDISKYSNTAILLDYCKDKNIQYLVVLKKNMDSYASWCFWPDFFIQCEGIYRYNISNGEIDFIRDDYNPKKYQTNDGYYLLIKLKGHL